MYCICHKINDVLWLCLCGNKTFIIYYIIASTHHNSTENNKIPLNGMRIGDVLPILRFPVTFALYA